MHLILQDGFWFIHISFICMVKFKFLPQFPVDHLPYPVVSSLILFNIIIIFITKLELVFNSMKNIIINKFT